MNLKQLETFFWVATLNSFRKAADRLCATQPAVSSRIAAPEDSLSVKLFERQSGTFSLTAKGQELMPYATNMLLMAERLKEKACETTSLSGTLRLGVSETIVHTWLPDFLNRVHLLYTNIDMCPRTCATSW
jgi:DNA-binding transcriptional LysR family regulator